MRRPWASSSLEPRAAPRAAAAAACSGAEPRGDGVASLGWLSALRGRFEGAPSGDEADRPRLVEAEGAAEAEAQAEGAAAEAEGAAAEAETEAEGAAEGAGKGAAEAEAEAEAEAVDPRECDDGRTAAAGDGGSGRMRAGGTEVS